MLAMLSLSVVLFAQLAQPVREIECEEAVFRGDAQSALRAGHAMLAQAETVEAHRCLARANNMLRNLPASAYHCEAAIHLRSNDPITLRIYAMVLNDQGRYHAAASAAAESVRLDPNDYESQFTLGVSLHNTKNLDGALDAFAAALAGEAHEIRRGSHGPTDAATPRCLSFAANPQNADALKWQGHSLREQPGGVQNAIVSYERALALRPDDADLLMNV